MRSFAKYWIKLFPNTHPFKFYPKPWWCDEIKEAKRKREAAYRKYRKDKTVENYVTYKRLRAEFTHTVKTKRR